MNKWYYTWAGKGKYKYPKVRRVKNEEELAELEDDGKKIFSSRDKALRSAEVNR